MAMLAGPRRKQKVVNLRAKNNAWSNDSSKFGQKMLEKMGWSEGKGLGVKEDGIVSHVVARYKNDEKGLGFEDKNDQWTKHEDDFNALLANLSNSENQTKETTSGTSLEAKSKKSKARVHYHKFTRGKDLSRYSEKDLANIFGKKSLKHEKKMEILVKEDIKTTEQVFTEKGSMEDYFKNKLDAFKCKSKFLNTADYSQLSHDGDDGGDYCFRGFSGTGCDENVPDNTTQDSVSLSDIKSEESKTKLKSKKQKKKKHDLECEIECGQSETCQPLEVSSKSSKKTNKQGLENSLIIPKSVVYVEDTNKVKKRKKGKSRNPEQVEEINEPCDNNDLDSLITKKSKKKKNK